MDMAEKNNVTCRGVEVKTKTKGAELEIVSVVVNTKAAAVRELAQ